MARARDKLYEGVAIDSTGTPIDSSGDPLEFTTNRVQDAGLYIDASEAASFAVEMGAQRDDGTTRWFGAAREYSSTDSVSDQWTQTEQRLRVTVTTAASGGATADVYLSLVEE